jgi:hypothetical protein
MAAGDFLGPLNPREMTDAGMWTWSIILTVLSLAASYAVAVAWQRYKAKKKDAAE